MRKRELNLNVRVSEEERDKLHVLADAADETGAQFLRRFINKTYDAQFGVMAPKARSSKR